MKKEITIIQDAENKSYSVTTNYIDCTRDELITDINDKEKDAVNRKEILHQLGEPVIIVDEYVDANKKLPFGIIRVNKQLLEKRFDFIGVTEPERASFVPFCMNYTRKEIEGVTNKGKDCIDSHFKNLFARISKFTDREVRELFLCFDIDYIKKYLQCIEINKRYFNPNHKIRTIM